MKEKKNRDNKKFKKNKSAIYMKISKNMIHMEKNQHWKTKISTNGIINTISTITKKEEEEIKLQEMNGKR